MQPPQDKNFALPPPVYSMPPRSFSFPLWGRILLGCGILLILLFVLLGFGVSRLFLGGRGALQTQFCAQNLRTTQRGLELYSQDYDQTLPPSLRLGKWPCVEAYHRYLEQPLAELRARVVTQYNREIRARSQPMVTDLADEGWMRWDALCLALEGKKKEESMKEMLAQLSPPLRAFFEAELERASSGELPWDLRRKAG